MDFGSGDSVFDFDGSFSKSGKKGGSNGKRKQRTFGKALQAHVSAFANGTTDGSISSNYFSNQSRTKSSGASIGANASSSLSSPFSSQQESTKSSVQSAKNDKLLAGASIGTNASSSLSSPFSSQPESTKSSVQSVKNDKSSQYRKRRIKRLPEDAYDSNDDNDEVLSQHSGVSSSCEASYTDTTTSEPVVIVRSNKSRMKNQMSVCRGAGSSAYAVLDAGTNRMIQDECSYLCSTILSKRTPLAKAVDAAIELTTLLSSRKTRSLLWQNGGHGRDNIDSIDDDNQKNGSSVTPIPKVWSSIFEVLALASTPTTNDPFDPFSSNCSVSSISTVGSTRDRSTTKSRTKSARRKEKELLQTGGFASTKRGQTDGTTSNRHFATSKDLTLHPDMKDMLACIFYFLSWDCTMSSEHSIAVMGAVKSSGVAKKVRMAILERGSVLSGILGLVGSPSQSDPAATAFDSSRQTRLPSSIISKNRKTIDPPVSPLRAPKRSLRSASNKSSSSQVSDPQQDAVNGVSSSSSLANPSVSTKKSGDPTASGRRKRKNKRKLKDESLLEEAGTSEEIENRNSMPPPSNRRGTSLRKKNQGNDEFSFTVTPAKNHPIQKSQRDCETDIDTGSVISESSIVATSVFTGRAAQKIDSLRAKVHIESLEKNKEFDITEVANSKTFIEGDRPWLSMVCLESLTRILTGKELNGKTSCLEEEEASASREDEANGDDEIDDDNNVVMVTNRLVGKSGMIPLLSSTMSQTMTTATKIVFGKTHHNDDKMNDKYWIYCYNRLKLLSSIIDEACFFSERNRRSFCEDDPFSFQDRKKGLIFHILVFLQQCSRCNLNQHDQKRSETMSLALSTLTSLTHDNELAAEQMKSFHKCHVGSKRARKSGNDVQGIQILADLVFQLEETSLSDSTKGKSTNSKSATDHDMHHYDGAVFCLTTLANVTEGAGIGRMLAEIEVTLNSGKTSSWLEWLCQWTINRTESFQHEILSIGNPNKPKKNIVESAAADSTNGEFQQDDVENLLAAGNGCVVLACLITEPDDDDVESSKNVRNLIMKQMPLNSDGSSSGLSFVVNTLKAYCNYYHMSMGHMSVAVVAPVKQLIVELEEVAQIDEDQDSHGDEDDSTH